MQSPAACTSPHRRLPVKQALEFAASSSAPSSPASPLCYDLFLAKKKTAPAPSPTSMPTVNQVMRKAIACLQLALLFALVTVASLIPCPLLAAPSANSQHPGCPRSQAPLEQCPLAPTLESCPYFITEAKIGTAPSLRQLVTPVFSVTTPTDNPPSTFSTFKPRLSVLRSQPGLYLKYRVIRI